MGINFHCVAKPVGHPKWYQWHVLSVEEMLPTIAQKTPSPASGESSSSSNPNKPDASSRLKQLKDLYDQGLINKDEYDQKVKEIMDSL